MIKERDEQETESMFATAKCVLCARRTTKALFYSRPFFKQATSDV